MFYLLSFSRRRTMDVASALGRDHPSSNGKGQSHKFTYQKLSSEDPGLFCIVTEMFRCASVLQPGRDTAFFA